MALVLVQGGADKAAQPRQPLAPRVAASAAAAAAPSLSQPRPQLGSAGSLKVEAPAAPAATPVQSPVAKVRAQGAKATSRTNSCSLHYERDVGP